MKFYPKKPLLQHREVQRSWKLHQKRVNQLLTSHSNRSSRSDFTSINISHPKNLLAQRQLKHSNQILFQKIMFQKSRKRAKQVKFKKRSRMFEILQKQRQNIQNNQKLLRKISSVKSQYSKHNLKKWAKQCDNYQSLIAKTIRTKKSDNNISKSIINLRNSPNKILNCSNPKIQLQPCMIKMCDGKQFNIVVRDLDYKVRIILFPNSIETSQRFMMQYGKVQFQRMLMNRFQGSLKLFLRSIRINQQGNLMIQRIQQKRGQLKTPWPKYQAVKIIKTDQDPQTIINRIQSQKPKQRQLKKCQHPLLDQINKHIDTMINLNKIKQTAQIQKSDDSGISSLDLDQNQTMKGNNHEIQQQFD